MVVETSRRWRDNMQSLQVKAYTQKARIFKYNCISSLVKGNKDFYLNFHIHPASYVISKSKLFEQNLINGVDWNVLLYCFLSKNSYITKIPSMLHRDSN